MKPILEIQHISKKFKINHEQQAYLSLRDSFSNMFKQKKTTEDFLALNDVNFNVEQGDTIGIMGKNGAGKSTLLKILSKITPPTSGKIICRGRIASLLEVGTGFHPELSGRENIFMNGSILGMRRAEILKNFDAIVDFAGVEKFIDTPLKHYSSGMQLRLAFAVAAFLENEILIIDEVLAVGDAEFQKKCMRKMEAVSKGGRTILFVSHNISAIQNLCKKSVLLSHGNLEKYDSTPIVTLSYLANAQNSNIKLSDIINRKGNGLVKFVNGYTIDSSFKTENKLESNTEVKFVLEMSSSIDEKTTFKMDIGINNYLGDRIAWLSSSLINFKVNSSKKEIVFVVQRIPLAPGDYNCNLYLEINNEVSDWLFDALPFTIIEKDYYNSGRNIPSNQGNILLNYTMI